MPLRFVYKNIIEVPADIIVSPCDGINYNENSISEAIARAGGKKYARMIAELKPISIGDAVLTNACKMNYKYVAHVAIPDRYGGKRSERVYFDSCYNEVLCAADEKKCKTIVFPVLGIGLYGVPYNEALSVEYKLKSVMIGHAVSNALGVPVELASCEELDKNLVTDMEGVEQAFLSSSTYYGGF